MSRPGFSKGASGFPSQAVRGSTIIDHVWVASVLAASGVRSAGPVAIGYPLAGARSRQPRPPPPAGVPGRMG